MLRAMAASIGACGTCTTPSEARARVTLWPAVKGSLASTALARLFTVWVNMSRISTTFWYAWRVVNSGSANGSTPSQPAVTYITPISHASGASPAKLTPTERKNIEKVARDYPGLEANRDFGRDMVNVAVGIVWQTALTTTGIFLVIEEFEWMLLSLGVVVASMFILKFNWYDRLEDYPDVPAVVAETPPQARPVSL